MNDEIEQSKRRITVIVDPHIKVSKDYFVYADGLALEEGQQEAGNYTSIFVKKAKNNKPFEGICWPWLSVWIDFLNENGQKYWESLFSYEKFPHQSSIYNFWNDMNEPSVFSTLARTIPMSSLHYKIDGRAVEHRDIHNAYGALQQRSSWRGMFAREQGKMRPFVLTRSFFMGSQKYGTYWTGDNFSVDGEVYGSLKMLLTMGLAGIPFGGSDIPGFTGNPTEELFIRFYQLGMFYPFFRAHNDIKDKLVPRDPWLTTPRVQAAIRDAINRRYDLIHYIYTTFHRAT